MRVKTDAMRQAILAAATEVFREQGFERATMSAISERLGGSKATLYGYFGSKEELIVAVTMEALANESEHIFQAMTHDGDLRAILERGGAAFLKIRLSAGPLAIQRIVLGQAGRTDLGAMFYEHGPGKGWRRVADYLEEEMRAGRLRQADPWIAATQLKALLEADLVDRAMLGVESEFSAERIRRSAQAGVDTFLRAYGFDEALADAAPVEPAVKSKQRVKA